MTTASAAGPVGNTFDKYGSSNAVVRRLMGRFVATFDELVAIAGPASALDVGCGEGVLTARLATGVAGSGGDGEVVGIDLPDPGLQAHWDALLRRAPGTFVGPSPTKAPGRPGGPHLRFAAMAAETLEFDDGAFELVCAIEVLEHVVDPDAVLTEMARVSGGWLLVSVPREPLWRVLNLARGAYLGALGNTPGHVQHFGARSIAAAVARHAEVIAVRAPLPWTMVLARTG